MIEKTMVFKPRSGGTKSKLLSNPPTVQRPDGYRYLDIIEQHIRQSVPNDISPVKDLVFNGNLIYPRQLEIHLPGSGRLRCNFDCDYCQGNELEMPLGRWEEKGLRLLDQLKGAIPYHVYGGAYTEPLMNRSFSKYLQMTKKYHNSFGIHSNGSLLPGLEKKAGLVSMIVDLAESEGDYFSCSLDAGSPESHRRVKNTKKSFFEDIMEGLELLVRRRGAKTFPKIRVVYLVTPDADSKHELDNICKRMRDVGVDSLRFSVPYANYGRDFEDVRRYRENFELPYGREVFDRLASNLSANVDEKPFIFWHDPENQSVERMDFTECLYSYYQITFAADGNMYKCSSTATPSFPLNSLGPISDDLEVFNSAVLKNHDRTWDAKTCFCAGARCNRIALEINDAWRSGYFEQNRNA